MRVPLRLSGMDDRNPQATVALAQADEALATYLTSYGYRRVAVPVLEETELFLRKSGGELASRMYTFTDPGGHRVSLRPEFTSSVVRAYLEGLDAGPLPLRLQYQGPVFRYEADETPTYRQFTQVGAELLGASGPWADAEVLALACNGLSRLGVKGHRLVIGHVGFIAALLDSLGLSDRARLFLLASVSAIRESGPEGEEVRQRAQSLGLLPGQSPAAATAPEEALDLLERSARIDTPSVYGVRTPDEIRERYLRKQRLAEDPSRFGDALELVGKIVLLSGAPEETVRQAGELAKAPAAQRELEDMGATLEALENYDLGITVAVDFGLARGIAYYTGVVFELQHPALAATPSLGGGGRYDGLVQALGGQGDIPAMGFAWTLERAVEAQAANSGNGTDSARMPTMILLRAQEPSALGKAVREAERLRAEGNVVELDVACLTLQECQSYATGQGIRRIVTVSAGGEVTESDVPEP